MNTILLLSLGKISREKISKEDMTGDKLYQAARGFWSISAQNQKDVKYVVAVDRGIILEIYSIERWDKAGTHADEMGRKPEAKDEEKVEFTGSVVVDAIRMKYIGRNVGKGIENPRRYLSDFNALDTLIQSNNSVLQDNNQEGKENMTDDVLELLKQMHQIIFYGPPGTGKTYLAKKILKELFGEESAKLEELQGDRWNIVQFHPSYNYEDFVRGIKVETEEIGDTSHVAYKTVNRIFGEMCDTAAANPEKDYALIIDEINRANVSAVLGELIYALEYRDEPVNTPYKVNGKEYLIVPKNLYIIGTMNSADRTIGQIDYAVRRRFAFIHCPPDKSVIEDDEASKFFGDIYAIFTRHISQDYDVADVRIGHSYFLASGTKLANKIIYQVIPILREYVKDGVLKKDAASEIDAIERHIKKDFNNENI